MTIAYGPLNAGIRFSWGLLDACGTKAYWFVKQLHPAGVGPPPPLEQAATTWPEPLCSLAKQTHPDSTYVHAISDRPALSRWSSSHVTLVGDACHAVTPNNGQGACMAIEDAFVLGVLLARHWNQGDGHIEACYAYERARKSHTARVRAESYKQMRIGQLVNPWAVWVRESLLRWLPVSVLEGKLRATNSFDVQPWLRQFDAERQRQLNL
eukprot:UC1_evm1s754